MLVSLAACTGTTPVAELSSSSESASAQSSSEATEPPDDMTIPVINNGEPVTINGWLNSFTPTINTEPTLEEPTVRQAPQKIANAFMELHPNVTIEWTQFGYGDSTFNTMESAAEWLTTTIAAGTAPDMIFAWGTAFADRPDWFIPFNDILEEPNPYAGEAKWKDMFPSYVWTGDKILDGRGNILAVPYSLFPGPPTGYFYNKTIFNELNLTPPQTWEETFTISETLKDNGYMPLIPWPGNRTPVLSIWDISINLGPQYVLGIMDKIDYNKDGRIDAVENARACVEGYFSPVEHEYARELWQQVKRKYTDIYGPGIENIDADEVWRAGKAGMLEDGLWRNATELADTDRNFEFGVVPNPIISNDTSSFVPDIEFTDSGPYQPDPVIMLNLCKPAIEAHGGQGVQDAAVAFLKYLSVPENLSMIIVEGGSDIGAVRGCAVPVQLADWIKLSFPKLPNGLNWMGASTLGGYTTEGQQAMSKELDAWVKGMTDDDSFFKKLDELSKADALKYAEIMGADTSDWNK